MARHTLDRRRNSSSLGIHGRCTLTTCPGRCLRIQALRWSVLCLRHLACNQTHLGAIAWRLSGVRRRRRTLLKHAIVHRRGLHMRRTMILVHLHVVCGLGMRCLGCPLLARSLSLLLLLNARGNRLIERGVLQVHRWHEGASKLLLGDEWM